LRNAARTGEDEIDAAGGTMPREMTVRLVEETLPPHDPLHGTNDPMVRRTLEIVLPEGSATWEQTDYGHPGRMNAWEPRHIDARLQAKVDRLRMAALAVGGLTD
jgi:hypothetical protein